MKKALPLIIIILAIVVVGGIFAIKKLTAPVADNSAAEEAVPDLPQSQWPTVSLTPSSDGHYLTLKITDLKVTNTSSIECNLLWKANNGGTITSQGTSPTFQVNGQTSFSKTILLGSESSGKIRFDQGVETGNLTLRFRDSSGKFLGKVSSDWHLQTNTANLTSVDGSYKKTLPSVKTGVWYITMNSLASGWSVFSSQ